MKKYIKPKMETMAELSKLGKLVQNNCYQGSLEGQSLTITTPDGGSEIVVCGPGSVGSLVIAQ